MTRPIADRIAFEPLKDHEFGRGEVVETRQDVCSLGGRSGAGAGAILANPARGNQTTRGELGLGTAEGAGSSDAVDGEKAPSEDLTADQKSALIDRPRFGNMAPGKALQSLTRCICETYPSSGRGGGDGGRTTRKARMRAFREERAWISKDQVHPLSTKDSVSAKNTTLCALCTAMPTRALR